MELCTIPVYAGYTLKLLAVNHLLAKTSVNARLGHTTAAVFTIPVK